MDSAPSRIHLHVLQPRDRPLALRTARVVPLEHARRAEAARGVAAVEGGVLLPILEADRALALLGEPRGHQLPRDGGEPGLHLLRERMQLVDGALAERGGVAAPLRELQRPVSSQRAAEGGRA